MKRRKLPKVAFIPRPVPPSRKLLARLVTQELRDVVQGERAVEQCLRVYQLALRGQQAVWFGLAKKYNLPSLVDFDRNTGEVFEKIVQGLPQAGGGA